MLSLGPNKREIITRKQRIKSPDHTQTVVPGPAARASPGLAKNARTVVPPTMY